MNRRYFMSTQHIVDNELFTSGSSLFIISAVFLRSLRNFTMQLKKWFLVLPLAITALSGCSVVNKLVYRIDINQGNYVEQKAVDKLRFGMNKDQVRYVLGSPMLVENGRPNTWYYIYNHTKGHDATIQKNLIVTFNDKNSLIKVSGDFSASHDFYQKIQ